MTPIDPSPEEIAAACAEIRSGWSEAEERRRSAWTIAEPVTASVVDDDLIEAAGA